MNGGKLRQCMMLVEAALRRQPDMTGVITYCSIHSPQGPITAATARHFRLPCVVAYGGASQVSLATGSMPRLAMSYGARVEVLAKSGRHNVLKAKAEALAQAGRMFVVQYGINLDDYGEVLLGAVAEQVQNIPDGLDDLYIIQEERQARSPHIHGIRPTGKGKGDAPAVWRGAGVYLPRPFPYARIRLREAAENEDRRREAAPAVRGQDHEISGRA